MDLFFLRHGPALAREEWQGADRDRPLTTEGVHVVHNVAAHLQALGINPAIMITSPCERALRTAALVSDVLGDGLVPIEDERLAPSRLDLVHLVEMLEPFAEASSVMLVGHDPSMSTVLGQVVGGGRFVLRKAGIARVRLDERSLRRGELAWLVPPRIWG